MSAHRVQVAVPRPVVRTLLEATFAPVWQVMLGTLTMLTQDAPTLTSAFRIHAVQMAPALIEMELISVLVTLDTR
jgi:hypothetical protein